MTDHVVPPHVLAVFEEHAADRAGHAACVEAATRHTVDSITSDALDALYADLDRYEEMVGELNEANTGLQRQAARAEQERTEAARLSHHYRNEAERIGGVLREVLALFTPVAVSGRIAFYEATGRPIAPDDYQRWRTALAPKEQ